MHQRFREYRSEGGGREFISQGSNDMYVFSDRIYIVAGPGCSCCAFEIYFNDMQSLQTDTTINHLVINSKDGRFIRCGPIEPMYLTQVKEIYDKYKGIDNVNNDAEASPDSPPPYNETVTVELSVGNEFNINDWFNQKVGLEGYNQQYIGLFIENGFDQLNTLKEIDANDLIEIGVTKLGHRKRILTCINELKERNDANMTFQ